MKLEVIFALIQPGVGICADSRSSRRALLPQAALFKVIESLDFADFCSHAQKDF